MTFIFINMLEVSRLIVIKNNHVQKKSMHACFYLDIFHHPAYSSCKIFHWWPLFLFTSSIILVRMVISSKVDYLSPLCISPNQIIPSLRHFPLFRSIWSLCMISNESPLNLFLQPFYITFHKKIYLLIVWFSHSGLLQITMYIKPPCIS